MKNLLVAGTIMITLCLTGCGLFPSESPKPQMPKIEQGTMPHFSDKTPENKQQEPQTQEQKTPTSNTQNADKITSTPLGSDNTEYRTKPLNRKSPDL